VVPARFARQKVTKKTNAKRFIDFLLGQDAEKPNPSDVAATLRRHHRNAFRVTLAT
jgi:ABC-type Fe3+ transport system substrate-binding protein